MADRDGFTRPLRTRLRSLFWRNVWTLLLLVVLVSGAYVALGGPLPETPDDGPAADFGFGSPTINETAAEQQVFELVNEERRARGLAPLTWHERGYQAAKEHAVDMGARDYYNHTSLDGETAQQRYAFCRGGENIAKTRVHRPIEKPTGTVEYTTADELGQGLFQSWMNSAPHREQGIRGDWVAGAAAIHITDENEVLAVLGFCSTR